MRHIFDMTNLYLHHRNSPSDDWTAVPSLVTVFPNSPVGTLPLSSVVIESGPQAVSPCGCSGDSTDDSYLILRVECAPIPLASETTVLSFLIEYKTATYFEAKMTRYGQGGYITATLSHITAEEKNGMLHLSFRLAAALADALTNT